MNTDAGGTARRPAAFLGVRAALTAALALPAAAHAQVMEIDAGGQVRTYDRPATFDVSGGTPIAGARAPVPHPRRRAPRAAPANAASPPALPGAALDSAAGAAELSPDLIAAVAWRESGYRPGLTSRAGAVGEMQLMPATARDLGVDPYDSGQNYRGGATYLRALMRRYDGDLVRALAAYNAGPGAVDRYDGVPPYRETRAYVAAILDHLSQSAVEPQHHAGAPEGKDR